MALTPDAAVARWPTVPWTVDHRGRLSKRGRRLRDGRVGPQYTPCLRLLHLFLGHSPMPFPPHPHPAPATSGLVSLAVLLCVQCKTPINLMQPVPFSAATPTAHPLPLSDGSWVCSGQQQEEILQVDAEGSDPGLALPLCTHWRWGWGMAMSPTSATSTPRLFPPALSDDR